MIARDCGGPVCWCGMTAPTYSTQQRDFLNSRPAEAFNALAYGIAVCAMQPGGIHYGGVHWELT